MERHLKTRALPKFRCSMHQTITKRPFSPPSFPARRKRRGRRRRVRNDHDGTSRRKRRLFSSVLVSSFPNRKLNLRFGFFHANLRRPLSPRRPRLPSQGPIPPIRGKCPEGTKGVGMLAAKQTERLSQICIEKPKPQVSLAVWKGRNEHRG